MLNLFSFMKQIRKIGNSEELKPESFIAKPFNLIKFFFVIGNPVIWFFDSLCYLYPCV